MVRPTSPQTRPRGPRPGLVPSGTATGSHMMKVIFQHRDDILGRDEKSRLGLPTVAWAFLMNQLCSFRCPLGLSRVHWAESESIVVKLPAEIQGPPPEPQHAVAVAVAAVHLAAAQPAQPVVEVSSSSAAASSSGSGAAAPQPPQPASGYDVAASPGAASSSGRPGVAPRAAAAAGPIAVIFLKRLSITVRLLNGVSEA